MKVVQRDLWFCEDCTILAINGEHHPDNDEARCQEVERAVASFGPHLVPDDGDMDCMDPTYECKDCGHVCERGDLQSSCSEYDDDVIYCCPVCKSDNVWERDPGRNEFSWSSCDCCGSTLGGARTRFAVLGEEV